jgi:hypothetical protein
MDIKVNKDEWTGLNAEVGKNTANIEGCGLH